MGEVMEGRPDTSALLRTMISFGITERLQISGSLPVPLAGASAMPSGRMMAMMSGNPEFESLLGWRFQTRPVGESARLESTVYVGTLVPLDAKRSGITTSPATLVSVASGYASRSHYFWAGTSYLRHTESYGERLASVASFSLVYGYRPPAWRKDYPKPDLRFFVEAMGDIIGASLHNGQPIADTRGRVALIGPTMLLLYKAYGIEGGVLFPVYQHDRPDATGRALPLRTQLHVLLLAFQEKGALTMNLVIRATAALSLVRLPASLASAEPQRVQLNVLGMD